MRVIAGSLKGSRLTSSGADVRPSSGRLREALFSILEPRILGCRFLDLYAGTGAVAIEALSRGASSAVLVEKEAGACRAIRKNLETCGVGNRSRLLRADALSAMQKMSTRGERFDLVFADPPYVYPPLPRLLKAIRKRHMLAPDGLFILERRWGEEIDTPAGLRRVRLQRYGGSGLAFFEASDA